MPIAFQKVPWRDDVVCIAKPMKIWDRLFLFDKPIECFIFQCHMKVALLKLLRKHSDGVILLSRYTIANRMICTRDVLKFSNCACLWLVHF